MFGVLSEEDPRPLLVLREFDSFDAPGNERLSFKLFTEKTVTLSHWFRCIRLPHHVMDEDHPFHNLYAGDDSPQLFLASPDGQTVEVFDYLSSRSNLEHMMIDMLERFYIQDPSDHVAQIIKLLPKFDKLDSEIQRLKEQFDDAIEDDGPRSPKARKLLKQLEKAEAEMAELVQRQEELKDIPLKV